MGLLSRFFDVRLYVRLSPQRLTLRDARSGQELSEPPELALEADGKGGKRVAACGAAAAALRGRGGIEVVNPFGHPRSLFSDFTCADQVFRSFVRRLHPGGALRPAPMMVLQPEGPDEGGYTQVELRVLRELALGAGADRCGIWLGRNLSDAELLSCGIEDDRIVLAA